MEPESTEIPVPVLIENEVYLDSAPLKVEEVFLETNGRSLGDVLRDAVEKVSIGDGELQDKIDQGVVKCKLAPSYGSLKRLDSPSFKKMDDATIIMLWVSLKRLSYARSTQGEELTFETVQEIFQKNPFLELARNRSLDLEDDLSPGKADFWKFFGYGGRKEKFRRDICKLLRGWFKSLVQDKDVRDTTDIPLDEIENVLAQTKLDSELGERWEKTFIDVAVLRFPDILNPYIRVYHIRLRAWAQSQDRILYGTRRNGATGEFRLREYKPREDVIKGLRAEVRDMAISEGEKLIRDLEGRGETVCALN